MRITLIILMVLSVLATAGLGILASGNGYGEDASAAAALLEGLEKELGADHAKVKELDTVVSGYKTSSTGALILVALSLALLVLTFMKKTQPQVIVVAAMVGVAVLFMAISPSFDTGLGPADARTQAMMVGVPAILAALFAFGAERKRLKSAA